MSTVRAARHAALTARDLGRYRLVRRLHRSTTAEVWAAVDAAGARHALKIASDTRHHALLRAELAWLSALAHPNIVRARELIEEAGTVGLALEYLPGGDLVSLAGGPPRCWLHAARQLVEVLAWLHERGVAHRDIKARNVMFDHEGRVRLIDFGSAKRFGAERTAGGTTDAHRLAAAGKVGADDDVHALAVLLHELVTGTLPRASSRGPLRPRTAVGVGPGAECEEGLAALETLVFDTLGAAPDAERPGLELFRDRIELMLRDEVH